MTRTTQLTREAEHRSQDQTAEGRSEIPVVLALSGTDKNRIEPLVEALEDVIGGPRTAVHVVHVFTQDEYDRTVRRLHFDAASPPEPDDVAKRHGPIHELRNRLADADRDGAVSVDVHGEVADDVGAAIVDVADEVDAARVIVGGRNRSPTGKAMFGSTAQYVLLNAPSPVTFVRQDDGASR